MCVCACFCKGSPLSLAKDHLTGAGSIWKERMAGEERHGGRRQKFKYTCLVVLFHTQMPGYYGHMGFASFKLYLTWMHTYIYHNAQLHRMWHIANIIHIMNITPVSSLYFYSSLNACWWFAILYVYILHTVPFIWRICPQHSFLNRSISYVLLCSC